MSLSLNQEVKKYSDQLSSGIGGDLTGFASEVEKGLDGAKTSVSSITTSIGSVWRDAVSARTVNLMQTANSKIDTQKGSLDAINSAAPLVSSLKTASDSYVKAYEKYRAGIYYPDSPPSGCEDEDAWRAEKQKEENNVKELEEAALSAANSVKGAFSSAGSAASGGGFAGGAEITQLTGAELKRFCDENFVDYNRVIVEKATIDIDGGTYDVYYVYDKNLQNREFENEAFRLYVDDSIETLKRIDDRVMQAVDATDIIFEQTYACDLGHKEFYGSNLSKYDYAQAWYISDNHNVTSWFPSLGLNDGSGYKYGLDSIIHEFGHVMDSALGNSKNGTYYSFETMDEKLANSKWDYLIEKAVRIFKSLGTANLCTGYQYELFKQKHSEYLAEFFYAYNSGYKKILKDNCPETYAEVERIINEAKEMKK